ncbi:MAG: TetR family transcriptional regulator [Alphaproteobacteria bacterium]|nr:TetR family transcriptional regulator [Alphaproteobacteria bacterium]MDX5369144.1 TetR family transcriptional regulator [Alphaproteobacteria bacterium]MDX5463840.1 TetR family transcriptional regulator [Alphaproteobacteria bacterium]
MSEATRAAEPPRATRDPDRTRARILAAARRAFADHGLAGARVDAIAEASGANKRMLYYYFGDKEGLFRAVIEAIYEELCTAAGALDLDAPPEDALMRYVDFIWGYYTANPEAITLLNSENLHGARHLSQSQRVREIEAPFGAKLDALLGRGRAAGLFRDGLTATHLHITVVALAYFFLSNNATLSIFFGEPLGTPAARDAWHAHMRTSVRAMVMTG